MKFRYVYGPVPSRRLGASLGINPVPFKTCSYSCVYCQLGRTRNLTATRQYYFPVKAILDEVKISIEREDIDYITIVGEGEPTLYSGIGRLILGVKKLTETPVAVITNGSLLSDVQVRDELMAADVVLPTFDAGDRETFRKINRPHHNISFEDMVEGLKMFAREYTGRLWVEIMLVKGINDSEEELRRIKEYLHDIEPERVYLNIPIRPPAESWVEPPDESGIILAHSIIGESVSIAGYERGKFSLSGFDSPMDALLVLIQRHPMREEQVIKALKDTVSSDYVREMMSGLVASGRVKRVKYRGEIFYLSVEVKRDE